MDLLTFFLILIIIVIIFLLFLLIANKPTNNSNSYKYDYLKDNTYELIQNEEEQEVVVIACKLSSSHGSS